MLNKEEYDLCIEILNREISNIISNNNLSNEKIDIIDFQKNNDKIKLIYSIIHKINVNYDIEKANSFINEIEELSKKYKLSLSHEDGQGSFIIEEYDPVNISWLKDANIDIKRNDD